MYFASELTRGACATLQTLVIKDCRVGSFGLGRILQGIKAGNLQSLRVLNFRGNFIRAEGICDYDYDVYDYYYVYYVMLCYR